MTTIRSPGTDAPPGGPVQARSIATRDRLIETALDVIYEEGYNRAATTKFAERAGVSRGALLHHFPTRSDIMVAAMEKLLADGTQEIRDTAEAVTRGEIDLEGFVEFVWRLFSGRFFYLSVEFINETRIDHELRARMIPVVHQFHDALDDIWKTFRNPDSQQNYEAPVVLNLTICLVRGMGIQTILREDPEYFRSLLETWKAILPHLVDESACKLGFLKDAAGERT